MGARIHFEGGNTVIPSDNITGTGTVNKVTKFTGANDIGDSIITDNGINVGIGTSSPNEKLHVNGGTTNVVANFESTDAKVYISFKDNTTTNTDTVFLGAEGDNMTFYAGSASSERMRITSTGNVGIGTTNPTSKLHVTGLPVFGNNSEALAGGLTPGAFYTNGGGSVRAVI